MTLTVTSAKYGRGLKPGEYVDVTRSMQKSVGKKGLRLPRLTNAVVGVPAEFLKGQRKRLWIDYTLDGKAGSVSVIERKSLRLPK